MASIYIKPGVYSQYVRTGNTINLNAAVRVVAVIGKAPHEFTNVDEAVVRASGYPYAADTADALENFATEIIAVGTIPGGNQFTVNTDYVLTDGKVDWSPGGDEPGIGEIYYVTYKFAKTTTDYDPQLHSAMQDIQQEYGVESETNTLSLGSKIAFENGAQFIITTQVAQPESSLDFIAALDKLKKKVNGSNAFLIIPLTTDSSVQAALKEHVEFMSSKFQRRERHGFISLPIGSTTGQAKAKAIGIKSKRIIFPWDEAVRDIKDVNTLEVNEVTLDGTFIGCGLAGMIAKYPVQEPMTRKTIIGFKRMKLINDLLETEKDDVAGNGVTMFEESGGIISIRDAVTTDNTTPEDFAISVMQIRDNTIKLVRATLDKTQIAKVGTPTTASSIKADIESVLDTLVTEGSLNGFGSIDVRRDPANPTSYLVAFSIDPAFPVNTIFITFTVAVAA